MKTLKKYISAVIGIALTAFAVWGVLYGAMLAAVRLVFTIALLCGI